MCANSCLSLRHKTNRYDGSPKHHRMRGESSWGHLPWQSALADLVQSWATVTLQSVWHVACHRVTSVDSDRTLWATVGEQHANLIRFDSWFHPVPVNFEIRNPWIPFCVVSQFVNNHQSFENKLLAHRANLWYVHMYICDRRVVGSIFNLILNANSSRYQLQARKHVQKQRPTHVHRHANRTRSL